MGLDMFVYRVSKPHLNDALVYDYNDLDGIVIRASDIDDPTITEITSKRDVTDRKLTDVLPYTQLVKVRLEEYDMKRIRQDFGLPEQSYICMISNAKIVVKSRDGSKKVEIPMSTIEEKYIVDIVENCLVANCDEVMYWRKAYDVQAWFHGEIPTVVENVGHYILEEELLDAYNERYPDNKLPFEVPNKEYALFYHEWY